MLSGGQAPGAERRGRGDIHQFPRLWRVEQSMRGGLFGLEDEHRFVVTDEYDDGAELVAETSEWAGTHLDDTFAELVRSQPRPVRLHQQIRLRLLRAR
jgi:hypothetical protein